MTQTVVYRFGAPTRGGNSAVVLTVDVTEQLRLAHRFQNKLVELSRDRDQQIADVWSTYPQVAAAEEALAAAEEVAERAAKAVSDARKAARSKKIPAGLTAALREARAATKQARDGRKTAIADVKLDARARLQDVDERYWAALTETRQEYSARGLYWATYNDVLAHHKTADQRVIAARKPGRPAQRRLAAGEVASRPR